MRRTARRAAAVAAAAAAAVLVAAAATHAVGAADPRPSEPRSTLYHLRAIDHVPAAAVLVRTPVLPAGTYLVDAVIDGRFGSAGQVNCTVDTESGASTGLIERAGGTQRFAAAGDLHITVSAVVRTSLERRIEVFCSASGPGLIRPDDATQLGVTRLAGSTVVDVPNLAFD